MRAPAIVHQWRSGARLSRFNTARSRAKATKWCSHSTRPFPAPMTGYLIWPELAEPTDQATAPHAGKPRGCMTSIATIATTATMTSLEMVDFINSQAR